MLDKQMLLKEILKILSSFMHLLRNMALCVYDVEQGRRSFKHIAKFLPI